MFWAHYTFKTISSMKLCIPQYTIHTPDSALHHPQIKYCVRDFMIITIVYSAVAMNIEGKGNYRSKTKSNKV